ncbi:MAG: peptidase M29 [Pigmentiphaga sp.]|nr:peptidase M29 [Pigmentiphaga sp.]
MLTESIEQKWIASFQCVFELCAVGNGTTAVILSETLSRQVNVKLAELALLQLGARVCHVVMPSPPLHDSIPLRSTGTSLALQHHRSALAAMCSSEIVIDCTVEGLLHTRELGEILSSGARLMMISNEHPEVLERLMPDPSLAPRIQAGVELLANSHRMSVTSGAGTSLEIDLSGAAVRGSPGFVTEPGKLSYWPAGLCLCFPRAHTVNGVLVLDVGDMNLTFKRYLESQVTLHIEDDYVTAIEGGGLDAELMRSYFAAFGDRNAYGVSHVGWGMNPMTRWDSLMMYDKSDINATEYRALAGSFLYSTGANEFSQRHTRGHFDLPLRNCTIALDGRDVIREGRLLGVLAEP